MEMETNIEREVEKLLADVESQRIAIEQAQTELYGTEITGTADRGTITVRMNGGGRFLGVDIHQDAIKRFRSDELGPMVLEAIRDAMGQLAAMTKERFSPFIDDPEALEGAVTYWLPEDAPQRRD
jgi:DNA-binding protein YbaB